MEINKQIIALGVFRANYLYNLLIVDVYADQEFKQEYIEDLEFYEIGYSILCENLRIKNLLKEEYLTIREQGLRDNGDTDIFYSLRYLIMDSWEAGRQLLGRYGFDYVHEYDISTSLTFYGIVTNELINLNSSREKISRVHFIDSEYFFSSETAFYNLKERLQRLIKEIQKSNLLSEKIVSRLVVILDENEDFYDLKLIKAISSTIHEFIARIYSPYDSLEVNKTRFVINKEKLVNCPSGKESWRDFEDICEGILEFSLVPQFSRLYVQVRSGDHHERRDIVVPNTLYRGVWNSLFYQYQCNNIVFEIKNKSGKFTKDDVNQLRIYLSKPTIGKFGFLILRGGINSTIEQAIKYCYSDASILILTLNDNDLKEMMLTKSIYGHVDLFVEKKKIAFELNY